MICQVKGLMPKELIKSQRWIHVLHRGTRVCVHIWTVLFFCVPSGLFTLTGVSIYIKYSNQAMEEFQRIVSPENLSHVDVYFGWSLATAWLSYSLEVATGLLLMLAARITQMKGHYDSGVSIAML